MNITIISVGKLKEKYLKLGIEEFSKRLSKYCKLDMIELDDEKCPESLSEKDMLIVKDKEGKTFDIATDSVILSVGYKPAPIAEKAKHVHIIGDANKVGNLRTVIWGAWDVCMKL